MYLVSNWPLTSLSCKENGTDEVDDEEVIVTDGITAQAKELVDTVVSEWDELIAFFTLSVKDGSLKPQVSLIWFKSAIILSQSVLSSEN